MKYLNFIVFVFISQQIFSQTNLYVHDSIDVLTADHKTIAILPFDVSITLRPKEMEKLSAEEIENMEIAESESIQTAMYSWFLKRKQKGKLSVDVQDIKTTTAKLLKAEIDRSNIDEYTPKEIAAILEVDAVIMGDYETNKPMSEGASIALGVLIGFWGTTNKAVINLNLYNEKDGVLLVNYHKGINGSLGSSNEDLINRLMRKASRRIAYSTK